MSAASDSNLMLGLMAWKMEFIGAEQLLSALHAWSEDKAKPLPKLLIERGDLSESQEVVLHSLVEKGAEESEAASRRQGDSLTVLNSRDAEELETLIRSEADEKSTLQTALPDEETMLPTSEGKASAKSSPQPMRYHILRPHAKGGLGEVLVAEDQELHREVALKRIQDQHADRADSRSRFVLEAEITGRLEHPGIVPVYGLGAYPDGRPYYAMRFIKGQSLKEAVDQFHRSDAAKDPREFRWQVHQFVRRLIDVCDAMHYAHSRGVLHRDLKPGNVMLGRYGETLVVDWGLAKTEGMPDVVERSGEVPLSPVSGRLSGSMTVMGSAMGTPQFMSPEQAEGKHDRLTPASDVYGLGATLYYVVTGKVPYEPTNAGDVTELLTLVKTGKMVPPRQRETNLDPALAAICTTSMAARVEERYQTAEELARELERWLAGEPVLAYPEPWTKRMGRWARRHWTLVMTSSAVVLASVVLLAVGLVLLSAANVRERRAKEQAEANLALAEKYALQSRAAIDRYFVRVSEDVLLNQPGMQTLRRQLLSDALEYYQTFQAERPDDRKLDRETALASYFEGRILEEIDTLANAGEAYERAETQLRELMSDHPTDEQLSFDFANVLNALGRLKLKQNENEASREFFARALEIRERLAQAEIDDVARHRKWANTVMNLGLVQERSEPREAEALFAQAQSIREPFLVDVDDDASKEQQRLLRDRGMGYFNWGNLAIERREFALAEQKFDLAREDFMRVLELNPHDFNVQYKLALSQNLLGDLRLGKNDLQGAYQWFSEARNHLSDLVYRNGEVVDYRYSLAGLLMSFSQLYEVGSPEAEGLLREASGLLGTLHVEVADRNDVTRDYAVCLREVGLIERARGNTEVANEQFELARELMEGLVRDVSDHGDYRDILRSIPSVE